MILLLPVFDFSNIVICQWFGEKKKKKRKERKKKRDDKLSYPCTTIKQWESRQHWHLTTGINISRWYDNYFTVDAISNVLFHGSLFTFTSKKLSRDLKSIKWNEKEIPSRRDQSKITQRFNAIYLRSTCSKFKNMLNKNNKRFSYFYSVFAEVLKWRLTFRTNENLIQASIFFPPDTHTYKYQ